MNKCLNLSGYLVCLLLFHLSLVHAQGLETTSSPYEHLFIEDITVVTASLVEEKTRTAPSNIEVYSKEQIRQMGFKTLHELLYFVMGYDPACHFMGGMSLNVRGIAGVKLMIDGHDVLDSFMNTRYFIWPEVGLDNFEKVEIIRGPGSCLYGTNAFGGVINLITKRKKTIQDRKNIVSVSGGSRGFFQSTASVGMEGNHGKVNFFLDLYHYDGARDLILEEDQITGHPAALTPGPLNENLQRQNYRFCWDISDFTFDINYARTQGDFRVGINPILTDDSLRDEAHIYFDGQYVQHLSDECEIRYRAAYDQFDFLWESTLFPRGFFIPYDLDKDGLPEFFPEGGSLTSDWIIRKYSAEAVCHNRFSDQLTLIAGLFAQKIALADVHAKSNFNMITSAYFDSPDLVDVTSTMAPLKEEDRNICGIFLEGIYDFSEALHINAGGRYDYYSDFGSTFNPRLSLVYLVNKIHSIKLIFGTAFKAPDFSEMYTINNPVAVGNPDLDPEKFKNAELIFDLNPYEKCRAKLSVFYNSVDDLIETGDRMVTVGPPENGIYAFNFTNMKAGKSYGAELEFSCRIQDIFEPYLNYSHTKSYYTDNHSGLFNTPLDKANAGFNLHCWGSSFWHFNAFYSGSRESFTTSSTESYVIAQTNFIFPLWGMDIHLGINNLFDKIYYQPSGTTTLSSLEMPGRTFWGQIRKKW